MKCVLERRKVSKKQGKNGKNGSPSSRSVEIREAGRMSPSWTFRVHIVVHFLVFLHIAVMEWPRRRRRRRPTMRWCRRALTMVPMVTISMAVGSSGGGRGI